MVDYRIEVKEVDSWGNVISSRNVTKQQLYGLIGKVSNGVKNSGDFRGVALQIGMRITPTVQEVKAHDNRMMRGRR